LAFEMYEWYGSAALMELPDPTSASGKRGSETLLGAGLVRSLHQYVRA
jgi:hypothetical protein